MNDSSTSTKQVKLEPYGYEKSGLNVGNEQSYRQYLTQIISGTIVDETIKIIKTEEEKKKLDEKIQNRKQDIIENNTRIRFISEELIPEKTKKIEGHNEGIITLDRKEIFSGISFSLSIVGWLFLTFYLLIFYTGIANQAFSKILSPIELLPTLKMFLKILKDNPFMLLAPSIFMALGLFLHFLLEKEGKIKYLLAGLIITVTLALDFVLGLLIHKKVNSYNLLVLQKPEEEAFKSIEFWAVISMGFLIYLLWSGLYHAWKEEWSKRDVKGRINSRIKELEKAINALRAERNEIEGKNERYKQEIESYETEKTSSRLSVSQINNSLDQFSTGWFNYLHRDFHKELRMKCEAILHEVKLKIKESEKL